MKKILTSYGKMYAKLNNKNTIDIYDSNKKYFTDLCFDIGTYRSEETIITHITNRLQAYNSVQNMLDGENINSYTYSENWEDLIEDIYVDMYEINDKGQYIDRYNDDKVITQEQIESNDYVNKIGKQYILLTEF